MEFLASYPVLVAGAASLLFGVAVHVVRLGLRHTDAQAGAMISIVTTAILYWLLAPALAPPGVWHQPGLVFFALVGLFHPTLSQFSAFEGNRLLGPTVSATLTSTTPLFAALGAFLLLGEPFTWHTVLGVLAIVLGVALLAWRGVGRRVTWPWWALAFPMAAAVIRGGVHMASKLTLALVPSAFMAALLSYSVAALLSTAAFHLRGKRLPRGRSLWALRWFVLGGAMNGVSVLGMYTALLHGRVVVVSPIISAFPLCTLALSLALGLERITGRIMLGVAVTVLGVVLVTQ